jgi:hypothetical protein
MPGVAVAIATRNDGMAMVAQDYQHTVNGVQRFHYSWRA